MSKNQVEKAIEIKTFHRWEVVSEDETKSRYVNCKCACGGYKSIRVDSLLNGESKSCGCLARELTSERFKGKFKADAVTRHPLYKVYTGMINRCYNKKSPDYKWYGNKGVVVDPRWLSPKRDITGFLNFLADMEEDYEKGLELERLDVDGNYSSENCKWVTRRSQLQNTTRNRLVEGYGIKLTVTEWGEFLGFSGKLLDDRINHLSMEGTVDQLLENSFKDRKHSLLYKGKVVSAAYIWTAEGYTEGQRNGRLNKYGDSITALIEEGIEFEVVKPREKEYMTFKEALQTLRDKNKDSYEEHLLFKIETQLEGF